MKQLGKKILAIIACVAMVVSMLPHGGNVYAAENAVEEYVIYPTPHEMTYEEGSYDLKNVNVIYDEEIDSVTKARLEEAMALKDLSVSESAAAVTGATNVSVGVYGSEGAANAYITGNYDIDASLFEEADAYFLASDNNTIVVLGKDTDASYYGLTTLYHVLAQMGSLTIRNFTVKDYADVVSRGFIEGYYGNPWSTEDRCNLMEWGGYYKLNSYFYAPKDDPKHNSNWRALYTEEEIETKIKPLAEAGNNSKCRFVFALHPYMYNPIRHSSEEAYQEDLAIMQAKFAQVIEAGVRQIAILADDAANVGGANYTRMLEDMTDWLKEMQKTYPDLKLTLPFVTQEYMYYGQGYYANFPENVQIVMTGGRVWGEVSNSFTSTFTNNVGRGPYLWINWPCTDNSKQHLIMGGYSTFLHPGVDPNKIEGIVLNPMQQSEPSKVAIFGNAAYSWNIWESADEADAAWNASFSFVDHNSAVPNAASNALRELSKHMINQNMDSRVTALQESVELAPKLDAFKAKLGAGTATVEEADALIAEFETLQEAAVTYRNEAGDKNIRDQIVYWLNCWDDTTAAVISYLNAVKAIVNGEDDAVVWDYYANGQASFEASKTYGFHYVDHTEFAEVGVQHIVPFMEALDEYLAEIAAAIVDPTNKVEVNVTAFDGGTSVYAGSLANVIDGDPSTYLWYSTLGAAGQYIGVDLGKSVNLGKVYFLMDTGDYWKNYDLQYSMDGVNYTTYNSYTTNEIDVDLRAANIEARYVRFYSTSATEKWTKFYEISVSERAVESVYSNSSALAEVAADVKTATATISGTHEITLASGEYVGLDLRRIKDLNTIDVAELPETLTLQVSKNAVDWKEAEVGTTTEDARYVRVINNTDAAVTFTLNKFEVTSNEVAAPNLYDTTMGINGSWGVAEDCRENGAAFDGDVNTITEFGDFPQEGQYIIYDLGQERVISKLEMYCQDSAVNYIRDAVIAVSNDLENWTDVVTIGDGIENLSDANVKCIDSDAGYSQTTSSYPNKVSVEGTIEPTTARYLRILMTATNNNRAVVFNEIEINNGEYVPVANDPTFDASHIEAQGHEPQKMFDGELTTSYKPNTTEAGYVQYTLSDNLDVNRINIVQKGTASDAKVLLYVEKDGEREWVEVGTLDKSLNQIYCEYDRVLEIKIEWEEGKVPTITEIVRFYQENPARTGLEAYIAALDVDQAEYISATYEIYAEKLAVAKEALADGTSTEKELQAAWDELEAAVAGLVKKGDTLLIQAELDKAEALTEADYTEATWSELQAAVAAAKKVVGNELTEAEVAEVVESLQKAQAALVTKVAVSKDVLAKYIEDNGLDTLDTSLYLKDGAEAFEKALAEAKAVLADEKAAVTDVEKAHAALQDARTGLVLKATKAEMEALKALADSYKEEDYTTTSWAEFAGILKEAYAAIEANESTSEEVAAIRAALEEAAEGLVRRTDTSVVTDILDILEGLNPEDYTEESYKAVEEAVKEAKEALENPDITEEEVAELIEKLMTVVEKLVEVEKPVVPTPDKDDATSPETGDGNMPFVWFAVAAFAIVIALVGKRKFNK